MKKAAVILGGGIFAQAIAKVLRDYGIKIMFWTRQPLQHGTTSMEEALNFSSYVFCAVGTPYVPETLKILSAFHPKTCIMASKGVDQHTGHTMPELMEEYIPHAKHGVIAGPHIARDIMSGWNFGLTFASTSIVLQKEAAFWCSHTTLKAEFYADMQGLSLCSALKNVFALAYGLCAAQTESENMLSTIFTLMVQEMRLILIQQGCDPNLIFSFAGIGDLLVTCRAGRNYAYGYHFPEESLHRVEGIHTLKGLLRRIDRPFFRTLSAVLGQKITPSEGMARFLRECGYP